LTDALNQTGRFDPEFREWLNPLPPTNRNHLQVKWPPWLKIPFDQVVYKKEVKPFLEHLPRYLKIHSFDYQLFFDWQHRADIQRQLPGIKFVRLRRSDLIATAVSHYLAGRTGVFATTDASLVEYHSRIRVTIDVQELLRLYKWTVGWDAAWDNFLVDQPHLEVWYEELVNETNVIKTIYEYLGVPTELVQNFQPKLKKFKHSQTPELIALLKEQLVCLLQM